MAEPCLQAGRLPSKLRKRAEFLAVQRGEKRRGRFFLLEVLDRGLHVPPRAGITVTRKQGNAVERNRIRRRLREALRSCPASRMQCGHDYVIVARREVLSASFAELKEELARRIASRRED